MPPPHHYSEHGGRIAQMTKQEAVIANKRLELLEKKKNADLARQVVAAQAGSSVESTQQMSNSSLELIEEATLTRKPAKNHFSNDGSFFENFKRITEAAAKKAQDEKEQKECEELEAKRARGELPDEGTESGNDDAGDAEEETDSSGSASGDQEEEDKANENDGINNQKPINPRRNLPHHNQQPYSHQPSHMQQQYPPNFSSNLPPPPRPPISLMASPVMPVYGHMPGGPGPNNAPPFLPPASLQFGNAMPPPHLMPFNQGPPPPPPSHATISHFPAGMPPPFIQGTLPFNLSVSAVPPPPPPPIPDQSHKNRPDSDEGANFNQNKRDHFIDDNNFVTNERSFDGRPQQNSMLQQQPPQQQPSSSSSSLQSQHHGDETTAFNIQSSSVTTIDALIECVASNGDFYEDKFRSEHHDLMRSPFWFLNDKNSLQYENYRRAVEKKRGSSLSGSADVDRPSDDKYDPAEILNEDDDDANRQASSAPAAGQKDLYDPSEQHSDDYDSDSEYHQETKERNFANIKKKLSGPPNKRSLISNQYDSSEEEENMEMYNRIQMQEGGHSNSNDSSSQSQPRSEGSRPYFEMSGQDVSGNGVPSTMGGDNLGDHESSRKRKRSRWGEKVETKPSAPPPLMSLNIPTMPGHSGGSANNFANQNKPVLSAVTRTDPALLSYARDNFGSTNLSEEDWKKCEDHFKINLLYQDMLHKRNEIDRMAKSGKFKYEYDSDEDVNNGTWEHKLREKEMEATQMWADALTTQSAGKHHIGDFLPPEELKKFMEQYDSKKMNREPDLSDYKEFKLREDNKGFQMLQRMGWNEGQGLGFDGGGIKDPINKAQQRDSNQGLGSTAGATPEIGDNEYDAYRKRMMLAYRFRPNPLNNPRRAYY